VSPTTRHDTTGRAAAGGPDDVGTYVAAVRARLDDLAPEEVEELTGGLEADLAEALAGFDETPRQRFGDPAAYADELRAAADLPPRAEPAPDGLGATLGRARRDLVAAVDLNLEALQRLPWFVAVRDYLVILRPAWWVLRAWLAVAVLRVVLNAGETGLVGGFPQLVLLVLAIVASVAIGRRSPPRSELARGLLVFGNVVAVLALPVVLSNFSEPRTEYYPDAGRGLWMDGQPVQNVVPYDSQGRPLQDVQLYDDQGRPLQIGEEFRWWSDGSTPQRWNVFPLDPPALGDGGEQDGTAPEPTGAPTPADTASPTATPGATAAPSATPSVTVPPTVTPTR
jgi:hypothetical protein